MLPEFPKARQKMIDQWNKAFFEAFHQSNPFVAQISIRVQKEGNVASFGGGEINYKRTSVQSSFPTRDGQGMNAEEFFGIAHELGSRLGAEQATRAVETMSKPSPHGMPVFCDGPLHFDVMFGVWEKMDIDFGKDGKPRWPTITLSPQYAAELKQKYPGWLEDPIFKQKMEKLIEQKRREFNEREARRRLVD